LSSNNNNSTGERLRVAVVGGGAAGLATALHLAPLVNAGLIGGPVDVYDDDAGGQEPSNIGVGIWSTALNGFRDSRDVESHQIAYKTMVEKGTFSEKVGFRSPRGDWLAESNLAGDHLPDFLFLRESDMLGALQKAVHLEVRRGNVVVHSGPSNKIHSISEDSPNPWSAPLLIETNGPEKPAETTKRDYHLIVAADGMNSILRKTYGGHVADRRRFLGTSAMENLSEGAGPLDLPDIGKDYEESWALSNHAEATGTQDRSYHVFRGNSPVTQDEVEGLEKAFQTWGESGNMRFATVPMECPLPSGGKEERHTWFITIDDENISSEEDPSKRKDMLLEAFRDWHDPIRQLVEATPPDEILMDRAVAHKHSCEPIVNFNEVVHMIRKKPVPASGNGPAIQFVGDAFMTVDPILAQGFTFGMEGAAALAESLSTCLDNTNTTNNNNNNSASSDQKQQLAFDPYLLRRELLNRHDRRLNRLICLLRSSELVQALGQPTKGSIPGLISRDIIRPLMRLTPGFVKTPIFNRVMKYSLGLHY
jgi:2-polyprenyl-6-methoxyphenol hydroxylase-like FAD-dependent oxidoreductase